MYYFYDNQTASDPSHDTNVISHQRENAGIFDLLSHTTDIKAAPYQEVERNA